MTKAANIISTGGALSSPPEIKLIMDEGLMTDHQRPLNCFETQGFAKSLRILHNIEYKRMMIRCLSPELPEPIEYRGLTRKRFGFPIFEAFPMGGYTQLTSSHSASLTQHLSILSRVLTHRRWFAFRVSLPIPKSSDTVDRFPDLGEIQHWESHVVDLARPIEEILLGFSARLRTYLRKCDPDMTISHHVFEGDQEPLRRFLKLIRGTAWARGLGSESRVNAYIESLYSSTLGEIWLCHLGSECVAGAIFLVSSLEAVYYSSATSNARKGTAPFMDYILWDAIQRFHERGIRSLDLCPSQGLPNVDRFKSKFTKQKVLRLMIRTRNLL